MYLRSPDGKLKRNSKWKFSIYYVHFGFEIEKLSICSNRIDGDDSQFFFWCGTHIYEVYLCGFYVGKWVARCYWKVVVFFFKGRVCYDFVSSARLLKLTIVINAWKNPKINYEAIKKLFSASLFIVRVLSTHFITLVYFFLNDTN